MAIKKAKTTLVHGTSMPTAPSTNDRFYRDDHGREYYYDGTRWLSVTEFVVNWGIRVGQGASGITATTTMAQATVPVNDIYLTDLLTTSFVNTTNSGTQYWTIDIQKRTAANSSTTVGTVSTISNAADTWIIESTSVNAVIDGATEPVLVLVFTKVSTAGNLFAGVEQRYRLITT